MKHFKKILGLLLIIVIFTLGIIACQKSSPSETSRDFDEFTDHLFLTEVQRDTITLNYSLTHIEKYGIENTNITLGHFSPAYIETQLARYENYLSILNEFNYDSLTDSQQLTYDILKRTFELDLDQGDLILYHEVLGPTTGIQAQLPVLLAEYNLNTKDDLETYLVLLTKVREYFEEISEFQKLKSEAGLFMNDHVADSIINQCLSFIDNKEDNFLITVMNEKIAGIEDLTQEEIAEYQKTNHDAVLNSLIPAYEHLVDTLQQLKGTGKNDKGLSHLEKGKEYYEYLIAASTNSSKTIPELIDMVDESIINNITTMSTILTEDPTVYDEVISLSFPLTEPSEIITYLEEAIVDDFPPIPDVNCSIKYVHESMQEHLSPAMYLIPAIDDYENNVIYINPHTNYDLSQIFPTMAHEGYPGHLYQSVYFRNSNPSPIRSLLDFGGYIEGWATYVEYYSYYLVGFPTALADFLIANMITNMGIYCRLDMGIHYEGWSMSDASNYLTNLGINDKELTNILYTTIVEEPALYPKYGIGYLEIAELKNKAETALGNDFNLKDFHTFLLDVGPAQFSIIEESLDKWIKNH